MKYEMYEMYDNKDIQIKRDSHTNTKCEIRDIVAFILFEN